MAVLNDTNTHVDFLGNSIDVGDLIVYSPRGNDNGSLILAEVLELKPFMQDIYGLDPVTKKYGIVRQELRHKPKLRPINSSGYFGRDKGIRYDPDTKSHVEYSITPKPVFLQDCTNIVLIERGKNNDNDNSD